MRTLVASILFALAIVITVAVAPVSRWLFLNQVDLIFRPSIDSQNFPLPLGYMIPSWAHEPSTYAGTRPEIELTHALYEVHPQREADLYKYIVGHPRDVVGLAIFSRMTCMMGSHFPDEQVAKNSPLPPDRIPNLRAGVSACQQAERLEPTNAYFDILEASFNAQLGDLKAMKLALSRAALAPGYNSHLHDQQRVMENALELTRGYRGEIVKAGIDASILLPDYAHIKGLGKYLSRQGSMVDKANLMRALGSMTDHDESGIGILVAVATAHVLTRPLATIGDPAFRPLSDAQKLQWARDFDADAASSGHPLGTANAYDLCEKHLRLMKASQKFFSSESNFTGYVVNTETEGGTVWTQMPYLVARLWAPYVFLAALALAPLFVPSALWSACCAAPWMNRYNLLLSLLAYAFGVGFCQLRFDPASAFIGGFIVALLLCGYFRILFLIQSKKTVKHSAQFMEAPFIGSYLMFAFLGGLAITGFGITGSLQSSGPIIVVAAILCALRFAQVGLAVSISALSKSLIILSALYLISVGLAVADNHKFAVSRRSFTEEGPHIRELAGYAIDKGRS